ncbi:Sjogren's syndrome/scleroderma autoantigen 1 family protein [Halobacterium sp. R2-5]|uniref:Sjogren's syndrome/scleroderma autoantigen 1 family protein n=1 Tax=Halobacterium sp. R2-5 TaxID=2715751 RepID=UPI00141D92FA|nr:Sjogren's syndrome/scleroderma autoantigen 1 family protein [Halobacterium sp. R2-5]NIB98193.1 hypothetical protein [Halobacterium sp. R2-5]
MSDTDDGFDEEAVREELREKYEDDDRGETERMSELLLQGATMTNQHCDRCGNPIFRYEGQSFCPNCQQAAEQGQAAGQGQTAGQQDTSQQQADGQQPEPEPSADARANDQQVREASEASRQVRETSQQPQETAQQAGDAAGAAGGRESASPPPSQNQPRQSGQSGGAPSGEGAAALESSIAALARRAAGTDDPRRAREFLEAAREAAEALDALRRNA